MTNLSGNDETLAAYDEISSHYEDYSLTRKDYLDSVDRLVIERLGKDDSLLDIGSGDGRRLEKIVKATGILNPVAIEPSLGMAKLCEKRNIKVFNVLADEIDGVVPDSSFSRITALWNVFGHLPDNKSRIKALRIIKKKLLPGGKVIFDVNNRHNAASYGKWEVLKRRFLDAVFFNEKRGDASYDWEISGKTFASMGHLFTPSEVLHLVEKSGLQLEEFFSVNYQNGEVSASLTEGQIFLVLVNHDK